MVSRSARAAYLSVGTLVVPLSLSTGPLGVPAVEELLWLWEEELKHPKSALQDLGKWSKLAKLLALTRPPEAVLPARDDRKESHKRGLGVCVFLTVQCKSGGLD